MDMLDNRGIYCTLSGKIAAMGIVENYGNTTNERMKIGSIEIS
jgi:hypothetical protein